VQRYFRDHTIVAVLKDGTWVEITHRGDVARIGKEHTSWDGSVLCGTKGGVAKLRAELLDDPAKVQRWNVDERVVEGRRPEGPQFVLHRMSWNGVEAVGGPRQVVDAVLPGANKTLRKAATSLIEEHGEAAALRLSLACALRGIISDDELAMLLLEPSFYELQPWLGVEIARYRENFLRATEHIPQRRGALIRNLLTGETLTDSEIVTALDKADRISPLLAEKLIHNARPSLLDIIVDVASMPGLSREQHLEILLGDKRHAKSNLAGNPELDAQTVEDAYHKGADLSSVLTRVPMTEAMFELLIKDETTAHLLCANNRLSASQLQVALEYATGEPRHDKGRALFGLAQNTSTSTETRLDLIRLTIDSTDGGQVRSILADNITNTQEVYRALLSTNDVRVCRALVSPETRNGGIARLDTETLRSACDVKDASTQKVAVQTLLKRTDVGAAEELRLVETCAITTWPGIALVCRHPETVERILEKVAELKTESDEVKTAVSLIEESSSFMEVRDLTRGGIMELVAGNNNGAVTKELVNRLATDANISVAMGALYARGAQVDEAVRVQVALTHPEVFVRSVAYKTRERMEELQLTALRELPDTSEDRRWIVTEAYLGEETQRSLLAHGNITELVALGANKCALTDETLRALASHQSPAVRSVVAARRDLSEEALEILWKDDDAMTQEAFLSSRYGRLYDERGERIGDTKETTSAPSNAATTDTVTMQGPREENRDIKDIHVITTRRGDAALMRSHHPIEYAAEPAAVIRESIAGGVTTREQFFSDDVNDVRRLPDWGVLPFRSVEAAQRALDGYQCSIASTELLDDGRRALAKEREDGENTEAPAMISLEARVLDSRTAIEQNAEYMGNCTGGYVSSVARGEIQLVGLYDKDGVCQLNVELQLEEDEWKPGEINTRFNGYRHGYANTPEEARVIGDALAELLNKAD
jgi:hypothetical protein